MLFQPPAADESPSAQPAGTEPPPPGGTGAIRKATSASKATSTRKAAPAKPTAAKATSRKTTPAKKTASAKSTRPRKSVAGAQQSPGDEPSESAVTEPAAAEPAEAIASATSSDLIPAPPASEIIEPAAAGRTRQLLARLLEQPGYAPELLALAAVETLGPGAGHWVRQMRADYPNASPDGLARLATQRFVRLGVTGGALAAVSGLLAPLAELVAVAWVQANLALHLAACYDEDPTHPDRAVDLLVLTQVHADDAGARAALDAARAAGPEEEPVLYRMAEAGWRLATPLAAQTGGWLVLRLLGRGLPGAVPLAAVAGGSAAAQRLAARAVTRYRSARHRPIPSPGARSGADAPSGEPDRG